MIWGTLRVEGLTPAGTDVCVPHHPHPPCRIHQQSPHPPAKHPKSLGRSPPKPRGAQPSSPKGRDPPHRGRGTVLTWGDTATVVWGHRSLGWGGHTTSGEAEPSAILGVTLKATASPNPRRRPARVAPAPRQAGFGPSPLTSPPPQPHPLRTPKSVGAASHPPRGEGVGGRLAAFGGDPPPPQSFVPLPPPKATAAAQDHAGPGAEPAPLRSRRTPAHDVGSCRIADAGHPLPGAPPGPALGNPLQGLRRKARDLRLGDVGGFPWSLSSVLGPDGAKKGP